MIKIRLMVVEQDNLIFLPTSKNINEILSKPGQIRKIQVSASVAVKLMSGESISLKTDKTERT